ncbi:MAG: hypothetical protein M4579_003832 [Chaenotheca gracillima]|nr:MAG: hypothetical protein M4579_003832 [Chaenotheca gracillima]
MVSFSCEIVCDTFTAPTIELIPYVILSPDLCAIRALFFLCDRTPLFETVATSARGCLCPRVGLFVAEQSAICSLASANPTSCISEAQKYQGHLYQPEKEKRGKAKSAANDAKNNSSGQTPRKAYVEDAPDADTGAVAIVEPPPPAPSPPRAAAPPATLQEVNVFDFLVNDETPNASTVNLAPPQKVSTMAHETPAVFEASRNLQGMMDNNASKETFGESRYDQTGYHYGTGPVPTLRDDDHQALMTPAPGKARESSKRDSKKEKKRKRHQVEELDLTLARPPSTDGDEMMVDAPPVLHSGLTGGLNRLLSRPSEFPPSPEYSTGDGADPAPSSPLKRSKHSRDKSTASTSNRITALVPTRRTTSTTRHEDGTRTKHRHHHKSHDHHRKRRHHHSEDDDSQGSHRHASSRSRKRSKAIAYPGYGDDQGDSQQQQLVVYRTRAEHFSSFITKGPDSEKGCSLNKVLKRYHRERDEIGVGLGRHEEEKALWKTLRLRKNEQGEIVLFA